MPSFILDMLIRRRHLFTTSAQLPLVVSSQGHRSEYLCASKSLASNKFQQWDLPVQCHQRFAQSAPPCPHTRVSFQRQCRCMHEQPGHLEQAAKFHRVCQDQPQPLKAQQVAARHQRQNHDCVLIAKQQFKATIQMNWPMVKCSRCANKMLRPGALDDAEAELPYRSQSCSSAQTKRKESTILWFQFQHNSNIIHPANEVWR